MLDIEVDTSLSSRRILHTLDRIIEQIGKPVSIRTEMALSLLQKILSYEYNNSSTKNIVVKNIMNTESN